MWAMVNHAECQLEDTSAAQSVGLETCVGTEDSTSLCKASDSLAAPAGTGSTRGKPQDLQGMEDTWDCGGNPRIGSWSFWPVWGRFGPSEHRRTYEESHASGRPSRGGATPERFEMSWWTSAPPDWRNIHHGRRTQRGPKWLCWRLPSWHVSQDPERSRRVLSGEIPRYTFVEDDEVSVRGYGARDGWWWWSHRGRRSAGRKRWRSTFSRKGRPARRTPRRRGSTPSVKRSPQSSGICPYRQLGHPSRSTLLRMMRLSGSNEEAIRYAKRFHCDVCAQRQRPRHPQASTASARPFGFNQHLHIDLKFVHDVRGKRYAVLSMLDLGTVKHDCVMVKTRRSDYIAGKFMRHWIMIYGVPRRVTHDQGGEFEQSFVATLEAYAITSDVTAAHAGWQLAAGERHGEIMGTLISAIVAEHGVEGYRSMKLAIAAAAAAKNATLTRDGFTPNQRVFGSECRWPSLNDEDCAPSFAEAVGTESEVARSHRMRTTARIALFFRFRCCRGGGFKSRRSW